MNQQSYLKIPHQYAQDILKLFEPSEELSEQLEENMAPAALINKLHEAKLYNDLVIFISHAIPVREAIWWGCCCLADQQWNQIETDALRAAQAWVKSPDETTRRHAEQTALKAQFQTAPGWIAQASFWSGGSITPPGQPATMPPSHLYAHAVAGAINLAALLPDGSEADKRYTKYIKSGLDIASGGNGS